MLHFLHINSVGLAILVFSFGAAFGIGWLAGLGNEGEVMAIGGALVALMDFTVRLFGEDGHWLYPRRGGMFLFLPVWVFGLLWLGLGVYRVLAG